MNIRRRLLCEQRGAISVLAGLSLVFIIASAAMTVDIGKATWQKRSLQKTVDVIALDAVRAVGDRKDENPDCQALAVLFAQQAADRNDFDYDNTALGNSMTVVLGVGDPEQKTFSALTPPVDCNVANAVKISATSRSDNGFMPGSVGLDTFAIAVMDEEASYWIGSKLVDLNTSTAPVLGSVLGQMLGGPVNLSAVGYNGLAAASVRMGDVWANMGLGTPEQILNSDVTFGQFLDASIDALNDQGDPTSVAAATTLGTLKAQITQSTHFKFGDFLEGNTGNPDDAADARINVLNMIGAAATVANGTNLINLTVPISIPGVASTTIKMSIIEAPAWCIGCSVGVSSRRHTGQARIQLDLTLLQKLTVLLSQGTVHLPVYLEAAGATGELTDISCANPEANSTINVLTTTDAVTAKVGQVTDATINDPDVPADVRDAQIVSITGLVNVTGHASATMAGSVTDLLIYLNQTRTAGASGVSVSAQLLNSLSLTVQVLGLGINAGTVLNNTLNILTPVLTPLDSTLLSPLKDALAPLGISLGAADVTNVYPESCTGRKLIG